MRIIKCAAGLVLMLTVAACGGGQGMDRPEDGFAGQLQTLPASSVADPLGLPADSLLPWESLDAGGFVDPLTARRSSAINDNSEFWRGVDAFGTGGSTSSFGQALRLESGNVGDMGRSFAIYRIPLAGENPATLSTDINLRRRSDGSASEFLIGIANYGSGRWDWSGPFTDGRIRLPLSDAPSGDYISGLGNAFISIVAHDGDRFDIVGVSLNQFDPGDVSAPPAPTGLNLAERNGAIEMQWDPAAAPDLAGYRIYHSDSFFFNPQAAGVHMLPYLAGGTRHLLEGISGMTFVAVSAVDLNGNEGPVSGLASAVALAGEKPELELQAGSADGRTGSQILLTASGADAYDWDLNGDGEYELTGDSSGSQFADTGNAGIIRPAVRGSDGGTAVAHGAVSLIIAANLPPVAVLNATPGSGVRWPGDPAFSTQLDASASSDEDPTGLLYAFDPLGSGNFGADQAAASMDAQYAQPGTYMAAVRLTDSAGLLAYGYRPVKLQLATDWDLNHLTLKDPPGSDVLELIDSAIVDGHPAITYRISDQSTRFELYYVRAADPWGRSWNPPVLIDSSLGTGKYPSLKVINGRPAISFARISQLCYIRAATAGGDRQTDWSNPVVVVVDDIPNVSVAHSCLAEVGGRPAIAFRADAFGGHDTFYIRASGGDGDLAGDWLDGYVHVEDSAGTGLSDNIELLVAGGNPALAISSGNTLLYERATSTTGDDALDWAGSAFSLCDQGSTMSDTGMDFSLVNGNPAVVWYDKSSMPYKLRYRRSTSPGGATAGDWSASIVLYVGDDADVAGEHCSLAEVNGKPATSFRGFWGGGHNDLFFMRALDTTGTAWGQLQLATDGLGDFPGYESCLVTHDGWAGIAHYDGLIPSNLLYFSSVNLD